MNASTDRDLLVFEPTIFSDVPIAAQTRVSVADAVVSGATLTSSAADFEAAGVGPGFVVLIGGTAHEVIARVDAHALTVSLLREHLAGPAIPGVQGSGLALVCQTFAPQAALVRDTLLRLLGIDPDGAEPGALTEDAVVSVSELARLEALGALERIYASVVAITVDYPYTEGLIRKGIDYRRRFREACTRAVTRLDADGDGVADRTVRLGRSCCGGFERVPMPVDCENKYEVRVGEDGLTYLETQTMEPELIQPLTQFGVAGLMGVLWIWERLLSRKREAQLDDAHSRLIRQGEEWRALLETVQRNTQALERFEQTQAQLKAILERLTRDSARPAA